jgi:hypothetical protein
MPSSPLLNCEAHGGPPNEQAQEMVYWQDIPTDYNFRSPLWGDEGAAANGAAANSSSGTPLDRSLYFTVEPDFAGFNNYRMAMEIQIVLAAVTGRVLVIPPARAVSHLDQDQPHSYTDFFDLETIAEKFNHTGFRVISYHKYLRKDVLVKVRHGKDRTGLTSRDLEKAEEHADAWLRIHSTSPDWGTEHCLLVIPEKGVSSSDPDAIEKYDAVFSNRTLKLLKAVSERPVVRRENNRGNPAPIDASPVQRMEEVLGRRNTLCLYDGTLQSTPSLHLRAQQTKRGRFIAHFYNALFFEDWRVALWARRFVRDNLRYRDEVQCAAARIVARLRAHARASPYSQDGAFYAMHIRRTDMIEKYESFAPELGMDAEHILGRVKGHIPPNQTIYIATDESNSTFFDSFREMGYSVYSLSDFLPRDSNRAGGDDEHDQTYDLRGLHKDYHGLVEQLVASRAQTFFGCYYSTFTGYINRLRGYHSQRQKLLGWEDGIISSYYYAPKHFLTIHRNYTRTQHTLWGQEYPVGWRDIDHGFLPWTNDTNQ